VLRVTDAFTGGSGANVVQWDSVLSYMWNVTLSESYHITGSIPHLRHLTDWNLINEWRPVIGESTNDFCEDNDYVNCRINSTDEQQQLFSERGYLWSYNLVPTVSHFSPPDDNAVHLTVTAFMTGPYIIRIRGQSALFGKSNELFFAQNDYGNGVPYTLNVNIGVTPAKRRPYWQYEDLAADPSLAIVPATICGR
jgi:hypothetical protein